MMKKSITRSLVVVALAALVGFSACADDESGSLEMLSPQSQADVRLAAAASDLNAGVGERITIAVEALSAQPLSGVQGRLKYDAERLEYLGQLPDHEAIVIVNTSNASHGEVRFASFSGTALTERVAKFAFAVRATNYMGTVQFVPEVVGDMQQRELRTSVARELKHLSDLDTDAEAVRWTHVDWATFADASVRSELANPAARVPGLPNDPTKYGDATLNGTINVLDASDIANTAVGNREVIIGTNTVDRVTAANVRPLAAAGCLAGFSGTNCTVRLINVLDASPVSQEALGADQAVVGDFIPLPRSSYASGDTVFLAAQTISGTRVFHRDTLYVLQGILTVGNDAGAAGELVVQAGGRVEGELSSAIFVTRNGRLISDGTPTQPITFTCRGAAGTRIPGCWGGVFISGNAVVNEQDGTLAGVTAPAIPLRNPTGGQNQRKGEGGAINYGGGNDADSSGVIRYTRFAYGGKDLGNNNELNNLTIGACGSGTILEHIQVHAGEDDGLELFGGRCNVRYLYATANDDDQFDYSFGYDGKVQFLLLQHCRVAINDCDKQFEVDNTETVATYNNTPRVNPLIYNVTSVGGAQGLGTSHIHYRRGAGGTIRNVLLISGSTAFTFDDAETCPANSGLSWGSTVIMSTTSLGGGTSGCFAAIATVGTQIDTVGYEQGTAGRSLKDPNSTLLPDFRPLGTGVASPVITAVAPPANGYFDTSANYLGAVRPIGLNVADIPWYAGWTLSWQAAATR